MGINDRQYYRDSHSSKRSSVWQLDELTPVVKYLLLSNIAVFLLQIFVVREVHVSPLEMLRKHDPQLDKLLTEVESGDAAAKERLKKRYPHLDKFLSGGEGEDDHFQFPGQRISVVQEWLELDTKKIVNGGQVWRLLTHAFCHERQSVWHIVLNMLCLYWFGCALESMYGPREFLLFYLTAAVIGGVGFVVLDLYTGSNIPGIGASGAVMGVMMLYTMHFPRSLIYILLIIPLEMRWVMLAYVIWDLHPVLLNLAGDQAFTGVGHSAHLAGLAFGFLYYHYHWRLEPALDKVETLLRKGRRQRRLRLVPETLPLSEAAADMDRVDELLEKILKSGKASLTEEELDVLQKASERMKNRASRGGSAETGFRDGILPMNPPAPGDTP